VIFSGGRGSASIARAAARLPEVDVTLVINGYDDGLSTGVIRRLVPGMLGPSDYRKAISNQCADGPPNKQALASLLEYRLNSAELSRLLEAKDIDLLPHLEPIVTLLSVGDLRKIKLATERLLQDTDVVEGLIASGSDAAFGNLVFAGEFLHADMRFNDALADLNDSLCPGVEILNATTGENLHLSGIKGSGEILWDEASIVGAQSEVPITEIFLTQEPLRHLATTSSQDIDIELLRSWTVTPWANPRVIERIEEANCIVFAPGTQHSSLFPTYLTEGIGEAVCRSQARSKILVLNLQADHDIGTDSALDIVRKFDFYMSRRSSLNLQTDELLTDVLVTQEFLSRSPSVETTRLATLCRERGTRLSVGDWGRGDSTHHGRYVVQVGLSRSGGALVSSGLQDVTIVIPVLNERERIEAVLRALTMFDWLAHGILPTFVAVDGGSEDGTQEILNTWFGVTVLSARGGVGRALEVGARAAAGTLWATFPADDEYQVEDLAKVLAVAQGGDAEIVFGSRSGFCVDPRSQLDQIYGGRRLDRVMSYYGGALLSVMSTLRHRRSVADPLTSIKAFTASTDQVLRFTGRSLNWHIRVIRDASRGGLAIAEIPVGFRARSRDQGKKTRIRHGLLAVLEVMKGS